jgi:membrane protease YdiL (CAAX protease family)
MQALEQALPREPPPFFDRTPWPALLVLAAGWAVATQTLPPPAARVAGLAAAHGGLLGTALAWTAPRGRRDRWAPLEAAALLATAAASALLAPAGALTYLLVPAWVAWRRPAWCRNSPAIAVGALLGLLLGGHLLVNAALTFGYGVQAASGSALLGWWGYDVGANVLAAEAFFRGALFERAHRRWSFAAAAALSTAASLARYLLDPLLPHSLGIAAGATFYLVLLGAGNCWLLARTGSLAPPLAAGCLFFGAYRLLVPR